MRYGEILLEAQTAIFRPAWEFLFLYRLLPLFCFCFIGGKIFLTSDNAPHFDTGFILLMGSALAAMFFGFAREASERIDIDPKEIRFKKFLSREFTVPLSDISSVRIWETFWSRGERRILIETKDHRSYKIGSNLFYLKEIIRHIKSLRPDLIVVPEVPACLIRP